MSQTLRVWVHTGERNSWVPAIDVAAGPRAARDIARFCATRLRRVAAVYPGTARPPFVKSGPSHPSPWRGGPPAAA